MPPLTVLLVAVSVFERTLVLLCTWLNRCRIEKSPTAVIIGVVDMSDWYPLVAFFAIYLALQLWILPKLGIKT